MKQRITSFDTFRAIAAFLIVMLHYPFQCVWKDEISVLCRIAVPFFFLVSGYFNYSKELQIDRNKRSLYKILKLVVIVNLVYLAFRIFVKSYGRHMAGKSIMIGIEKIFSELGSIQYIFFNFRLAGHLWYLRGMIFVLILLIIMKKFRLEKVVKWSIPIIIVMDLCICKYSKVLFGETMLRRYYEPFTKFIGVGYVYFFLGYFFREFEETRVFQKMKQFLTKRHLVVIAITVGLVALNLMEYHWLQGAKLDVKTCNYASAILLVMFLFCYLACNKTFGSKSKLYIIGARYSEYIYLYHILAGKMIVFLFKGTKLYDMYFPIRPIVLYLLVLGIAIVVFKVKDKLNYKLD